ncbi:hypothetical protein [Planococcus shixiaomingii]|uniref:hypothetical protein n=1 Tax=Planococcus shixiaomingii TaxID=3058393 RepID=UPI00265B00C6|nr:hypothetical protein [Planococcus sp. N028]
MRTFVLISILLWNFQNARFSAQKKAVPNLLAQFFQYVEKDLKLFSYSGINDIPQNSCAFRDEARSDVGARGFLRCFARYLTNNKETTERLVFPTLASKKSL